jgi:glycosyltransferase involved in cell wall biosynthesis
MKICIINNIYPPYDRGGAEQVVVKTVEGLVARGHDVVIITSTPEKEVVESVGRVTIYRLHPQNFFFYTEANQHSALMRLCWHVVDIFHVPIRYKVRQILKKNYLI